MAKSQLMTAVQSRNGCGRVSSTQLRIVSELDISMLLILINVVGAFIL
jgi:hypothetical protein